MSYKALLIQPNGDTEFRQINDYTDIQAAVGGDFDWTAPGPVDYFCYEYALYERPFNPVASSLYAHSHGATDPLCGPVLVVGPPDARGEGTDVPEEWVRKVQEARERMGQDEIDRLAVPLSAEMREELQRNVIRAQAQAMEALKQGRSVDFGGIVLGVERDDPMDGGHRYMGRL